MWRDCGPRRHALELRYTPVLNRLDAHRYADRMASEDSDDDEAPRSGPFG